MHLNLYIVIGSAIVGLLVGMTGAGGGALMTPMLVLLFGVTPASAISSDLVASVVMRPVGAAVHMRAGTIHKRLVLLLASGSVPAALVGSWILSLLAKGSSHASQHIELALGAALLVGTIAMVLRGMLDRRGGQQRDGLIAELQVRPLLTLLIGAIGGLTVGMTSVGAGSLMIVLLLFLYPRISAKQLVGTDLTQAVPLTLAAALGSLLFGHVEFGLTVSLLVGSVPAVFVGALLSSHVSDRYIRPAITFVICASGLKYVGLGVRPLAATMICLALLATIVHLIGSRRRARAAERQESGLQTPAPLG